MTAALLFAPAEYPDYEGFGDVKEGKDDFVHLYVTSKAEFMERFAADAVSVADNGLLWVSYPKSAGKQKYDIDRDILWDLAISLGWHLVAQVSLDETWSAIRLMPNQSGVKSERPNAKKG